MAFGSAGNDLKNIILLKTIWFCIFVELILLEVCNESNAHDLYPLKPSLEVFYV